MEFQYHVLTDKDVLAKFNSSLNGIKDSENRLKQYGLNELKEGNKISPFKIFIGQFSSPLVWILIAALAISIFLHESIDAVVIGIIIVLNAVLGFVQEYNAEKAIEALKKLSSLKAKVIRNGKEELIDSKYVVPGDIILLETGDKVPADSRMLESISMSTQEGSLTGESNPVTKIITPLPEKTVLAERKNMVYSSTIISQGRGKAVVIGTGMNTEVGKIAKLIEEASDEETPLQKKLNKLGKSLTIAVVIIALIVFATGIFFHEQTVVGMFLIAVSLAVAAIPEGLPAIITISLAVGVKRMLSRNALVRKLPSVETLGSVDVICSDKTGTLTHNQMTVTRIWTNNQEYEVTGSGYEPIGEFLINKKRADYSKLEPILKIGALCNSAKLTGENKKREVKGDPTEAALLVSAEKASFSRDNLLGKEPFIEEIPFTSERKMMTTFHKYKNKAISYTKGAPDIIVERCDRILISGLVVKLDKKKKAELLKLNESYGLQALRVLGFAYNENKKGESAEKEMIFIGFQAMIDPPREEVKSSIQDCKDAGIRVIMITGDQLATAKAIAAQLGIEGKAVSGQDFESLDLNKEIKEISIFARVNPEDKLKIVDALKHHGHIVAMTGDGVNDAPALKKADIGIAMGITGTDVAKEASEMILTDDNFTSIVNAVEEGRGIFDNIRKSVDYLLSSNLGEITAIFLASLLAPLFGLPLILPLTPIQILWVNLVTDGLPATALSVDPNPKDIMKRGPKPANEDIISKKMKKEIVLFGVLMGIFTLGLFWIYLSLDSGTSKAQSMAFTSLVFFELVRLQMIRSSYKVKMLSNKYLIGAVLLSIVLQVLTLETEFMRKYFGTASLGIIDWLVILFACIMLFVIFKIVSLISSKIMERSPA